MNDKDNQWLEFIDDYDKGLIKVAEKKNKTLEKARIEMNYLTGEEEVRRLAELREKWEMDYNSGISYAKEEGQKQEKIKIAKQLLKMGLELEKIQLATGLTKAEIEKIK